MIDLTLWMSDAGRFLVIAHLLPKVRIHSAIARYPWARLWYLARAYDPAGSGKAELSFEFVQFWLSAKGSTVYEWLRKGQRTGAFREYSIKGDSITLYLGSLANFCKSLGLRHWGAATDISIWHIRGLVELRSQGMKATAIERQHQSMVAARRSLQSSERKFHPVLTDDQVRELLERPSLKPDGGQSFGQILHQGPNCLFVSAGFVPVGTAQAEMAIATGWSISSVQRRLAGLARRQICQAKAVYRDVRQAMDWEIPQWAEPQGRVSINQIGDGLWSMTEQNGLTSSKSKGLTIHQNRFFTYLGKVWIYRCNLYLPSIHIASQRFLRLKYRNFLSAKSGSTKATNHKENLSDFAPPKEDDFNLSSQIPEVGS